MKLPHRLALTALLGVPLTLFFVAKRANQQRPQNLGFHRGCEFLVFSPDGKTLLSTSSFNMQTMQSSNVLWNSQSGQQLRTYNARDLYPQKLTCFSPDGNQVARVEKGFAMSKDRQIVDKTTMLISTPAGKNLKRFAIPQQRYPNYDKFTDRAVAARWSNDGKEIIVQGGRDIRRVFSQTGQVRSSFLYRAIHFSE